MRRRIASTRPPGTYSPSARTGRRDGGSGGVTGTVRRAGSDALPTVPVDSWATSIRRWSRPDTAFRFRGCFDMGNPLQHNPGLADPGRTGCAHGSGVQHPVSDRADGVRVRTTTPRIGTRAPNLHTISRIFSPYPLTKVAPSSSLSPTTPGVRGRLHREVVAHRGTQALSRRRLPPEPSPTAAAATATRRAPESSTCSSGKHGRRRAS